MNTTRPYIFASFGQPKETLPKHGYSRIDKIALPARGYANASPTTMAWETVLTADASQASTANSKKSKEDATLKIALRGMHYSAKAGGLIVLNGVAKKGTSEVYILRHDKLRQRNLQLSDLVKRVDFIDQSNGRDNSHPYQLAHDVDEDNAFVSMQNTGDENTFGAIYVCRDLELFEASRRTRIEKGIGIVVFNLKKKADLKQDIIFFPRDIIGLCVSGSGVLFFSSFNEVIMIDITKKKLQPTFLFSIEDEDHLAGICCYDDFVCVVGQKTRQLYIYSFSSRTIQAIPVLNPENSLPEQLCIVEL